MQNAVGQRCRPVRQFIEHRDDGALRDVGAAEPFVQTPVVLVHVAAGVAVFIARGDVIDKLRKRVVRQKGEPLVKAPLAPGMHTVRVVSPMTKKEKILQISVVAGVVTDERVTLE